MALEEIQKFDYMVSDVFDINSLDVAKREFLTEAIRLQKNGIFVHISEVKFHSIVQYIARKLPISKIENEFKLICLIRIVVEVFNIIDISLYETVYYHREWFNVLLWLYLHHCKYISIEDVISMFKSRYDEYKSGKMEKPSAHFGRYTIHPNFMGHSHQFYTANMRKLYVTTRMSITWELWNDYQEVGKYRNFISWLPREMIEDTLSLLETFVLPDQDIYIYLATI